MEQQYFESLYPENTWEDALSEISKFILDGKSCQLLSIPGVGRSTILGLLAHNVKVRKKHFGKLSTGHFGDQNTNLHFVLVNFSEIKNRTLFDVTKFLFLSLTESLRDRKSPEYTKINDMFREHLGFNDELVLFQGLKQAIDYLILTKKLKIVFLFDRFEEYVPQLTTQFFTNLTTLRHRGKYQFLVLFSLNRPIEDLVDREQLYDYYEFVADNHVFTRLHDKVTTEFRIGYVEAITKKKIDKKILSEIIQLTGGVGRLIKLSVESVLAEEKSDHQHDLSDFLFAKKSIQGVLMDICRSFLPVEQKMLITKKFEDSVSKEYLEQVGILKNGEIQVPLFERHLKTHIGQFDEQTTKITYDENTNTIKTENVILSDKLTSSEFKLLQYLLQNPDQILERDKIINVVWSNVKSTAGITDQAVDQLIFRLRRKIEEDPNQPTHLLTVKGRGFRFIN